MTHRRLARQNRHVFHLAVGLPTGRDSTIHSVVPVRPSEQVYPIIAAQPTTGQPYEQCHPYTLRAASKRRQSNAYTIALSPTTTIMGARNKVY